mmetsp:Transcript_28053/g.63421  ORF Transcript_28053/g.63421 Transcript_28053/m.63421 type:complete len:201 (+) Transcript_28053:603-1205(+)
MNEFAGSIIAVVGKNSLCIASDTDSGTEGFLTELRIPKIFKFHDDIVIGMVGFLGDIYGFKGLLEYEISFLIKKEQKKIEPLEILSLISILLYKKRFNPYLIEILVGGFTESGRPFLGSVDCIGAISYFSNYVCIGSLSESVFSFIHFLWTPKMSENQLFYLLSRVIKFGSKRNCYSSKNSYVLIFNIKQKEYKAFISKA